MFNIHVLYSSQKFLPDISYKEFLQHEYTDMTAMLKTAEQNLQARNDKLSKDAGMTTMTK